MISVKERMRRYYPNYYLDSAVVTNKIDKESTEYENVLKAMQDVIDQWFPSSATWGLDRWEANCELPIDPTKPIDQRRSNVLAKLRGQGTATPALIKSVAETYSGVQVDVTEVVQNYQVKITFTGTRGVPPNLPDTQNAIRSIIPAHLEAVFVFVYCTMEEWDSLTWAQTEAKTWAQLETFRP